MEKVGTCRTKVGESGRKLENVGKSRGQVGTSMDKHGEVWESVEEYGKVVLALDVFLRNSALIPATMLSSRLPGDTPSSFILTGYGSDPRFLGGGYGGSKFPRRFEKNTKV